MTQPKPKDPRKPKHEHPTKRNEEFDAYYCTTCDKWLEKQCSDPKCEFCSKRPKKPSLANQSLRNDSEEVSETKL